MPSAQDYKYITREALDMMLDSPGETYEPRGLFICWQEIDGQNVWTAMRNENGEGLTEDFKTKRSAVLWLHGHVVGERNYWKAEEKSQNRKEADRLERLIGGKNG